VAVKILENVADNIEEIEEEFLVLRDLSMHPNIPTFHGLYLRRGQTEEEDQLWFTMEVSILCTFQALALWFLMEVSIRPYLVHISGISAMVHHF
jgi:hypothetical protein